MQNPPAPEPGSVTLVSLSPPADDGDTLRATASGFSNSPTVWEFDWERATTSATNCSGSLSSDWVRHQHERPGR